MDNKEIEEIVEKLREVKDNITEARRLAFEWAETQDDLNFGICAWIDKEVYGPAPRGYWVQPFGNPQENDQVVRGYETGIAKNVGCFTFNVMWC